MAYPEITKCRSILALLCLVVTTQALSANPGETERTRIEVWSWNVAAKTLQSSVPKFEETYPDIKADVIMSGTMIQSRLLLSLIAGVGAPDVTQLEEKDAARYSRSERLMDLTPYAQKYSDNFTPSFWENCLYEGRVYAIPWDVGPCAVFYRRSIFEKYEIDPDKITTWEEFVAAGEKIYERSGEQVKMQPAAPADLTAQFEILLQQAGGNLFNERGEIVIDSPETRQVLGVLRLIVDSESTATMMLFTAEFQAAMKTGRVATFPCAVWLGSTIKDVAPETAGDWGVMKLPAITPGGLRTSNYGGSVLVIPKQGKKQEEAWKFVEFMLCREDIQIAHYRNHDLFPALMTTYSDPFFDEPDPFYGGQKVRKLFAENIEEIPTMHRTKDWREAIRYTQQQLSAWALVHRDDEEFIRRLEEELQLKLNRSVATKKNLSAQTNGK